MTNPRTVLMQASQGPVPENWRVFTKKRGKLSGFLRGTSDDPDPLLVITPDEVIEYKDERKPLKIVNFYDLAGITLKATARTTSDSMLANIDVWVELNYRDGRKDKWRSTSFANDLQTIQGFIEAYGVHQALRGRY
ncbi:hypothetical protein OG250_43645 [Streptomyces sp. NBC_00487]|uniref:hypothetical protein n=1 Tax=unclassified Streptomyces TaxID=2593676 RepID=UPI002DD8BEE7|nr:MULTISPECIES: hypothetical protein [unclassified Streptomyces]WRZ00820.1 hypothetical protein OG889_42765 [Streptomyces sp. NBC_00481]